jgi:hypothetical protein
LRFCVEFQLEPLPVSEKTMLAYVAYLYQEGLKGSSISVYISAVKSLHNHCSLLYPSFTPRLDLALRGTKVLSPPPIRKLPITFSLLKKLFSVISYRHDELLLKLAMATAFFGCLRAGEICVPDTSVFDVSKHVSLKDVTMFRQEKMFSLLLRQSKTDKNSDGVLVYVGCSADAICAFCLMSRFLETRSSDSPDSPLFSSSTVKLLHKSYFVNAVKLLICAVGLDPSLYSGHSFRAGAATTGADCGFNHWEIRMLGRWSSDCFNLYLRNPKVASSFSRRLANQLV